MQGRGRPCGRIYVIYLYASPAQYPSDLRCRRGIGRLQNLSKINHVGFWIEVIGLNFFKTKALI